MSDIQTPPRTVGFWGSTLWPINGMIGAGIFALPAVLVAAVGNFAPWMMLLGGIMLIPLAYVFAQLGKIFDSSGGPVVYADASFVSFAGFQSGWMRFASANVAVGANIHVALAYLAVLFPALEDPFWKPASVVGFLVFLTLINLVGMRSSVRTLGLLTAVKLLPLIGLVFAGIFAGNPAIGFQLPQFGEFESVLLLVFYAFLSFENATYAAGEVKDAKRNIPFALVATLAIITVFYMLVIWAYLAIAPQVGADESALAAAASDVLGDLGAIVISVTAAFSIGANTFSGGMIVPRMTFGMAERGLLPRIFAHVSPRFQTPDFSIVFSGAVAIFFGLWGGFVSLAAASTLTRLITYVLSAAALPMILKRNDGSFGVLPVVMAVLAIAVSIYLASQARAESWQMLGVIFIVGTLLYFVARRKPAEPSEA